MVESAVIELIAARVRVRPGVALGIGDDAAALDDDPATIVTIDLLVDGVHFRRATTDGRDLGHKALAVNLSDLAAMGARPVAAVVGLGLPADLEAEELEAIYAGMEELAERHGLTVAGGDVTSAPALTIAVTALGRMPEGTAPARRSGGRPGDLLCVTGALGAGAAGLLVLDDPEIARDLPEAGDLAAAHRRPEPRLAAGAALAAGGVHALMDLSDGLALDAGRLARASGVAAVIDLDALPLAPGVAEVARRAGQEPDVLAATGGDDYELLAAIAPEDLDRLRDAAGLPLTPVGRLEAGVGLRAERAGVRVPLARLGWEHGA
ncbi:MAG: thiamine-monophosphate kinase [Miltoncostaeaceae bacterium]|nr:thiamine-monophosphate kinase [Miltoncostaeaceae bacterium]